MALKVYMGDELIKRIASLQGEISMKDVQQVLSHQATPEKEPG